MTKTIIAEDQIVTFEYNDKVAYAVFRKLLDWYIKHDSFCGESLQQRDEPQLDAINVLSAIADDIIKFDSELIKHSKPAP